MTTLTYSPATRSYVLCTSDVNLGTELGLTLSTAAIGANSGYTFYTSQRKRGRFEPVDNPYAVLPLYQYADEEAGWRLLDLWIKYEGSFATTSDFYPPCPEGLAYMPFQRAGIEYALQRPHALIGDEPGLGKTIQALGIANAMDAKSILVVCPASIREQWRKEIDRWCLRKHDCRVFLSSKDRIEDWNTIAIVSYEGTRTAKIAAQLLARSWDLLILDEAHYLKTITAKRTIAILGPGGLITKAERVVALTGTPLPNRPRECYTLATALAPESIHRMSYTAFCERYNPTRRMPNGFVFEKTANLSELQSRLRVNFMVRRRKDDVLTDLPDKRYELSYVESTAGIRKVIAAERLLDIDPEQLEGIDASLWGQVSVLRREMGVQKVPLVVDHIRELLDAGVEKLVVFAYHTDVIARLMKDFPTAAVIQGSTPGRVREEEKVRFQDDPKCRVFVGQLTAAGTGVDGLQRVCSHAVFAEASWSPGENEQCVDRLHRIGQGRGVLAQFLVAEGSLDERIIGGAIRKLNVINVVLDKKFTIDSPDVFV